MARACTFHQGTSEVLGRVSIAGIATRRSRRAAARRPAPPRIAGGADARRSLHPARYSPTMTIGGGEVLDPDPPRVGVRIAAALRASRRSRPAPDGHDDSALDPDDRRRGRRRLAGSVAVARAGVTPAHARRAVSRSTRQRARADRRQTVWCRPLSSTTCRGACWRSSASSTRRSRSPTGFRAKRRASACLRARMPRSSSLVLQDLAQAKRLIVRDRLALPGHRLELSAEETAGVRGIESAYQKGGLKPPDAARSPRRESWPPALVEKMTALLLRQKRADARRHADLPQPRRWPTLKSRDSGAQRRRARRTRHSGRGDVQGSLRGDAEICDPAARVARSRAGDEASGRRAGRALATDPLGAGFDLPVVRED